MTTTTQDSASDCGCPGREFATFVAVGPLAGTIVAALDVAVTLGPQGLVFQAGAHAAAIGAMWGLFAGIASGLVVAACRALRTRGVPRFIAVLPAVIPLVILCVELTLPLFDGPWIRSRSWYGVAKWGALAGGPAGWFAAAVVVAWAAEGSRRRRLLGAGGALVAAFVAGRLALKAFGAYPTLKWQFVEVAALGALAAVRLSLPRGGLKPVVATVLGAALAAAGLAVAVAQRGDPAIHRVRAAIVGVPLPVTSRLLVPAEEILLDRIRAIPPLPRPSRAEATFAEEALNPRFDQDEVERLLDARIPSRRRFNVLMIALDALRADHLSCHGYPRNTTPRLDRLARESAWFRRATSPVPASSMGYGSVFTGIAGRTTKAYGEEFGVAFPIPPKFAMAELLRDAGHETVGITAFHAAVAALPKFRAMADGFTTWNPDAPVDELRAPDVTDRALRFLRGRSSGAKPFLLFLHYLEPHAPYYFHDEHAFGREPVDAYDGEIAYADAWVGKVLDALEASGEAERTIVVVFGDHGEGFGEHNNREHGASLYDHQVRVPLIIRVPGLSPRVIDGWVGLPDVPVTLLRILAVDDPHRRFGRDLTPLILGLPGHWPDAAYAERAASAGKVPRSWERALWHGDLKLIWKPHHGTFQVYDVAKDPGETKNLYAPDDPTHARLLALLDAFDRQIDGYWTGSSVATSRPRTLKDRFASAVDATIATDPGAIEASLSDLVKFFDTPGIDRSTVESVKLGNEALDRLRDHLVSLLSGAPKPKVREFALRLLAFRDDPALDDLLWTELKRGGHDQLMLSLGCLLARHGRRDVIPALEIGLDGPGADGRIFCASGLGALGDQRARPYLHMGIDRTWADLVNACAIGLGGLGDPTVFQKYLMGRHAVWRHPLAEAGILWAAERAKTATGTAALLKLSASTSDTASKLAAEELARRLSEKDLARALAVREAFAGADNALLYTDPRLALSFLATCGAADDAWVGYLWWKVFRIAHQSGDARRADEALTRLAAATAGEPGSAALVLAGREALAHPPSLAKDVALSATVQGALVGASQAGAAFFGHVRLTNRGPKRLLGGDWHGAVALRWRITDASGQEAKGPDDPRSFLPDAGVGANDTIDIGVMGRLPGAKGSYRAQLIAAIGDGGPAIALGEPVPIVLN